MEDKWISKDKRITKLALMKDIVALSVEKGFTKTAQDQYLDTLYVAQQVWPKLEEWLFPPTEEEKLREKLVGEMNNKLNNPTEDDDSIPVITEDE